MKPIAISLVCPYLSTLKVEVVRLFIAYEPIYVYVELPDEVAACYLFNTKLNLMSNRYVDIEKS